MKTRKFTTSESLILDAVRILASAVVAFGHLTEYHFSSGWRVDSDIARGAVAVFFVLSGFVIRHVTVCRPATLAAFAGDRASRIYSVALPALLLTLLLDTARHRISPSFYDGVFTYSAHPLVPISLNLMFLGQLWRHTADPLYNRPYWSINYEVAYYAAYGFFFYLSGAKRVVALLLLALLEGPLVLFLGLLWLLGVLSHDLYQAGLSNRLVKKFAPAIVAFLAASAALLYGLYRTMGPAVLHSYFVREYMTTKRISNANFAFGLLWIPVFLGMLSVARRYEVSRSARWVPWLRFVAEGTYPLYLLHYPIYVFIAAFIPYDHSKPLPKLLMFAFVLILGILAGHPANLLKLRLRSMLSRGPAFRRRQVPES